MGQNYIDNPYAVLDGIVSSNVPGEEMDCDDDHHHHHHNNNNDDDEILMGDLNAIDYAMVQMARAVSQIIEVCPQLVDCNPERIQDSFIQNRVKSLRVQIAKALKTAYAHGELPLFDVVMGPEKIQQRDLKYTPKKVGAAIGHVGRCIQQAQSLNADRITAPQPGGTATTSAKTSAKKAASLPPPLATAPAPTPPAPIAHAGESQRPPSPPEEEADDDARDLSGDVSTASTCSTSSTSSTAPTTADGCELDSMSSKSTTAASAAESDLDSMLPKVRGKWPPPLPPIKNPRLLNQVFTHKSVANRRFYLNKDELLHEHNERLEFIGDAILNFTMSDIVFRLIELPEGELTNIRSTLVCNNTLWDWATAYGLDKKLQTEFDMISDIDGKKSKLVSDVMEAYIGGLCLDDDSAEGYEKIQKWLLELAEPYLRKVIEDHKNNKPLNKEAKNELYVRIGSPEVRPQYITVIEGDNLHPFTVECRVGDDVLGVGEGANTKEAGWRAAMQALGDEKKLDYYASLREECMATGESVPAVKPTKVQQCSGPKDLLYSAIGSVTNRPNYVSKMFNGRYYCKVYMHEDELGEGSGPTRKEAEFEAAAMAIENRELILKWAQVK